MQTSHDSHAALEQLQAELAGIRHPKLSDERFDEAHELFESSSNQQRLILDWLTNFAIQHPGNNALSLLSVGCGSGILDNPLLKSLSEMERSIRYTGIDPNPVACRRFRNEFQALGLENTELDVHCETAESIRYEHEFDIIHAVHSLYYFADPAVTIAQLLEQLRPNGKLVIFHAPMAELNQLADCFWFHREDVEIWFSGTLETHLQDVGLTYSKSRILGSVDVTRCFDAHCPDGAKILDFITQVDCENLNAAARHELLNYMSLIAERDDARVLLPHPVDVFEIER